MRVENGYPLVRIGDELKPDTTKKDQSDTSGPGGSLEIIKL